jgi:adenylate kinase
MIVVLTGAPGAGKGTQAELLHEKCGYRKISTGDALRKHVREGSEIGKIAAAIMERGELVPDDVLLKIIKAEVGCAKERVIILDGYPRNLAQAKTLDDVKIPDAHFAGKSQEVAAALHLDVEKAELVRRLSGRRVCAQCGATYHVDSSPTKQDGVCDKCGGKVVQRADDSKESVLRRLDVYEEATRPVLDYYMNKGVFKKVAGEGALDSIFAALKNAIAEVEAGYTLRKGAN